MRLNKFANIIKGGGNIIILIHQTNKKKGAMS